MEPFYLPDGTCAFHPPTNVLQAHFMQDAPYMPVFWDTPALDIQLAAITFCSFEDAVLAPITCFPPPSRVASILWWNPHPELLATQAVYRALVYRVAYANALIERSQFARFLVEARSEYSRVLESYYIKRGMWGSLRAPPTAAQHMLPAHVEYRLAVWLDSHFGLMLAMADLDVWTDEALDMPDQATDTSLLDIFTPDPDRDTFHAGDMPGLTWLIARCEFWGTDKNDEHPIVHLYESCVAQRSRRRNLLRFATGWDSTNAAFGVGPNYWESSPETFELFQMAFAATMLGAYDHACVRPTGAARLRLYDYTVFQPLDCDYMRHFFAADSNEYLLLYTYKESMSYYLRRCGPLWAVRCKYEHALARDRSLLSTMDHLRAQMMLNHVTGADSLHRVVGHLKQEYDRYPENNYMPIPGPFERIAAELARHYLGNETAMKPALRRAATSLAIFTPWGQLPADIDGALQSLGASTRGARLMKAAVRAFETHTDTTFAARVFSVLSRRDLCVAHALFGALEYKYRMCVFPVSLEVAARQVLAMRRRHAVRANDPLPPRAGELMICSSCGRILTNIVTHKSTRAQDVFGVRNKTTYIDPENGEVFCNNGAQVVKGRDRTGTTNTGTGSAKDPMVGLGIFTTAGTPAAPAGTRTQAGKDVKLACALAHPIAFNVLGGMLHHDQRGYTICTCCGHVMEFDPANIRGNDFLCAVCVVANDKNVARIHVPPELRCFHCARRVHPDKDGARQLTIYVGTEYRKVTLCKSCYRPWMTALPGTLTAEVLRNGIMQDWCLRHTPSGILEIYPRNPSGSVGYHIDKRRRMFRRR